MVNEKPAICELLFVAESRYRVRVTRYSSLRRRHQARCVRLVQNRERLTKTLAPLLVFFALAAPAQAAPAAVVVVPPFDPAKYPEGAVGLIVPGAGETVTREGALSALVRGRTKKSLLGGVAEGNQRISLSSRPGPVTIYVSLPPAGKHRNNRRYPIAIVGAGYRGILESPSTRIRGLVSVADIAPTALGEEQITSSPDADATADLRRVDARLRQQNDGRNWAVAILSFAVIAGSLLTLLSRSRTVGRAALLAAPVALGSAIVLSATGGGRPLALLPVLAGLTIGASAAGSLLLRSRAALGVAFTALIGAYLVVLAARPDWPALATIGPNPSEGGRFYGSSNLTTSVLLTVALFAGAALGLRGLAPVGLLAIVTIGWSRAGADGGGLVVLAAAFTALAVRMSWGRLTARTAALSAAGAVALAVALVGLDAATGGRSHVTGKVGEGPGALADEVGNRLHISVERLASSWHAALVFAIAVSALVILATRAPRFAVGDALLLGVVVSLLVNDSPTDVAAGGAISYGVLWAFERIDSRPCGAEP
jgi:hypothetical protein